MKKRNSSIELLRIVCMIMIVTLHSLGFTGLLTNYKDFSFNGAIIWILEVLSFVAVNCYVLISAYFMCDKKTSFKKNIKLWTQVFFYSVLFLIIGLVLKIDMSNYEKIKYLLPFSMRVYWFPVVYMLLTLLSPIITLLIKNLNKKQFIYLLIINAITFSIIPYLFQINDNFNFGGGYGIVWFINLYLIAGYLKRHFDINKLKKKTCLFTYIGMNLLTYLIFIIVHETRIPYFSPDLFYTYPFILILISSVALFLMFLKIEIKNEKIEKVIIFLSSLTFGVYLIHEHPLVRSRLWGSLGPVLLDFSLVKQLIIIVIIYMVCSIIEYIRTLLFIPLNKIIEKNKIINKLDKKINEVLYEKS